jgi:hypothetical protein
VSSPISEERSIKQIGFETTEAVDDINILLVSNACIYIQAKAVITYSVSSNGELRSVLEQFAAQHTSRTDRLVLVTTTRSSKKVVFDLRTALDAFRIAPEKEFFRDQPRALTEIVSELRAVLTEILAEGAAESDLSLSSVDEIIRKMRVVTLDVEHDDPLEQAVILLLESRKYLASAAVWGKLIADCVNYGRRRISIEIGTIEADYQKFRTDDDEHKAEVTEEFLKVTFQHMDISTGRDVALCYSTGDDSPFPEGYIIVETYRFDEDCKERLKYDDDFVTFSAGFKASLLRRAATYVGMTRVLTLSPDLVGDNTVTILPINSEEDFEESSCANIHRERLQRAAEANPHPLRCVHCGRPVFSAKASLVELPPLNEPTVGLSHNECLRPSDRVIGIAENEFVQSHPELVNFDANAWYSAVYGGQIAFANMQLLADAQQASILWGGLEPQGPEGAFVVEISLQGGGREIVTRRNGVHRFSRAEADAFALQLNDQFESAKSDDPFCYTDQSKAFGPRSQVLRQIGTREKIIPVVQARVRQYEENFAARYARPGQWYAPLLYLRDRATGEPFMSKDTVFMLTDPLKLATYLDNWREAGLDIPEYETTLLRSDHEFDEFMRWNEGRECRAIVNPLLDPSTGELLSGHPIMSLEAFVAEAGA